MGRSPPHGEHLGPPSIRRFVTTGRAPAADALLRDKSRGQLRPMDHRAEYEARINRVIDHIEANLD
ncbi:MAG: hypothetical protein AAGA56_16365, partial [Myxococcota bacterium]